MTTLRRFNESDGEHCLHLFRDTIRRVNANDYDPIQIDAWASHHIDVSQWIARFSGRYAYVAIENRCIDGFADLDSGGYVDRLFVSANHLRQGIATAVVARLLEDAANNGIQIVSSDVSITARPFFAKMGFACSAEQTVECRGSLFINYRMTIQTGGQP